MVMANCAFSHYNKDVEPRKDEGSSGKGKDRGKSVIPSITTSKGNVWGLGGNSTRVELKADASSCSQ